MTDMGNLTGECDCSLDADDPDAPKVFSQEFRVARKNHRCCECGEAIPSGVEYEVVTMLYDGGWTRYKTCMSCYRLGEDLGCRLYGGLREEFKAIFGWDYTDDPSELDDDEE